MRNATRIVQAIAGDVTRGLSEFRKHSGRRYLANDHRRTDMYRHLTTTRHGDGSDTTELKAPKMPEEWECCGNGCDDCVWDSYFRENKAYLEKKQEQLRRNQDDKR